MEDNTRRVAVPRTNAADTMPQIDAIEAACALDGTIVNGEHNAIALPKRHDNGAGLHPRSLFSHNEFSTFKILAGFRQQECHLQRKHVLAV